MTISSPVVGAIAASLNLGASFGLLVASPADPQHLTPQEQQQLDQTIEEHLQDDTPFGDALRAFHSCVSRAARSPGYQGVLAVSMPGQPCNRTSEALFQQCMDVQQNKQACFVIVTSTALHADQKSRSTATTTETKNSEPDFDASRTDLYTGSLKQPDFSTNRDAYLFRTRIREDAAKGVNFAGRVAVVEIGCGTDCEIVYAVDLATGRVYNFPLGGEEHYGMTLKYRPSSRLVAAWWMQGGPNGSCVRQDFLWDPPEGFRAQGSSQDVPKPCPAVGSE